VYKPHCSILKENLSSVSSILSFVTDDLFRLNAISYLLDLGSYINDKLRTVWSPEVQLVITLWIVLPFHS
jgi:hypothetical protein